MKKSRIIYLAVIGTMLTGVAGAQEKTSFGVKLNANLTTVKLTDAGGSDAGFRAGASVAGFTRVHLTNVLSLQPELLLGYTESKVSTEVGQVKFKYLNVELPVYLQACVRAGSGNFIFGIGPHIGYGISADTRTESLPEGHPGENRIELDHWYAGGGVTAGYEFRSRVSVNAGYQLGYDFSTRHKVSGIRTQTISLGVAYRF